MNLYKLTQQADMKNKTGFLKTSDAICHSYSFFPENTGLNLRRRHRLFYPVLFTQKPNSEHIK